MNDGAATIETLAAMKRSQVETVRALLQEDAPIGEIFAIIAALNLEIHRQLLDHLIATTRVNGIDRPPVPLTLLVMGSAGRGESFLNPDQDNGFILGDYADEDHGRIDPYFIALSERFNSALASIGFPLCDGGIMARNPVWRKTASQWRSQLDRWTRRRDPIAVRFADSLSDFRAIAGPAEPADQLRAQFARAFIDNPALVEEMCRDRPVPHDALGWFGRLRTEESGANIGRAELKHHALQPLVASVRLWALRHGVPATGTLDRLLVLHNLNALAATDVRDLSSAYDILTAAILRQQAQDARSGKTIGYFVDPSGLSCDQRDALIDALRRIGSFSAETRAVFASELY